MAIALALPLCVQTLDPQLFRTIVEPLKSGAMLEEIGHTALVLRYLLPVPTSCVLFTS